MNFSFLPAEAKFYDYFEKAAANLLEGAFALQQLFNHYDYDNALAQTTRIGGIEHAGDLIVHEVTNLLPRTLITPIDSEDIQHLVSAIDDALDAMDAVAQRLLIYQVTEIKEPARQLTALIVAGAQELDGAIKALPNKRLADRVCTHIVQINTIENEGDRLLHTALQELVAHHDDIFNFIRWKEIFELLEDTTDRLEDAADIIQKVLITNA